MGVTKHDSLEIRSPNDVVLVRQAVRKWTTELGFGLVDQTKMITAASELARNTLDYGGGGTVDTYVSYSIHFILLFSRLFFNKGSAKV